jgi:hypothetical protein
VASLWPWLAVAGVGALHGLNPASGWVVAAACGARAHDGRQALRALRPIATGHVVAVAVTAATVALGVSMGGLLAQLVAGGLLLAVAVHHWRRTPPASRAPAGSAALALWSFIVSTAHGAGLMLVPALIPLCLGDGPGRALTASGSLLVALAAVGVHAVAMLAVTGLLALAACRGFASVRRRGALRKK